MVQLLSEADKVNFREIIPPEKFQEYLNDNSVEIDFEAADTPDFSKNLDTYISNIKEQKKSIPKEFQLISLCVDPKYFYTIPDIDQKTRQRRVDVILNYVEAANKYNFTIMPPEYRGENYVHESGLDKEFLLEYLPDDGFSIFTFVWTLMNVPELQRSPDFIIGTWHRIDNNPEDIKDRLFEKVSNELLDDEQFISDCLNSGMKNRWGHPLEYASKRIQKLYKYKPGSLQVFP
jgi:hypothetical protein